MLSATNSSELYNIAELSLKRLNFWVSLLGISTTILAAFFTISLAVIAILTWKHYELRKKAEEEVENIIKLGRNMTKLAESYTSLVNEMRDTVPEAKKLLQSAAEDAKEINKLATQIKEKNSNLDEIEEKIKTRANTVQRSLNSLASTSRYTPGDITTEAKMDAAKSALEKLLWPEGRDREVILEAMRQRMEQYKKSDK